MKCFETPYLTVEYNSDLNAVLPAWRGYVQPSEAKTGFEKILDIFCRFEATFILNDLRDHEGGFHAVSNWLHDTYMPAMIAAGYAACANIVPLELLMHVSLNEFGDKQAGVVPLRVFTEMEPAQNWIQTLQHEWATSH